MKIWKFLTITFGLLLMGTIVYGQVTDVPVSNGFNWWSVVQIGLGAVTTFFAGAWAWVKDRATKLASAGKEVADLLLKLEEALEDDTINKTEAQALLKEGKEAWTALKLLVAKKV